MTPNFIQSPFLTPRLRIWLVSPLLPINFLEFKLHLLFITGREMFLEITSLFVRQRKEQNLVKSEAQALKPFKENI